MKNGKKNEKHKTVTAQKCIERYTRVKKDNNDKNDKTKDESRKKNRVNDISIYDTTTKYRVQTQPSHKISAPNIHLFSTHH